MSLDIANPRWRETTGPRQLREVLVAVHAHPGLVLFILVLGHLLIMNVLDGGVQRINFGFVAGRWSSPFWQAWDLLQLWLAMLHGGNGMRTIINDYAQKDTTRFWLRTLLAVACVFIITLGTLVIFTFDPNLS